MKKIIYSLIVIPLLLTSCGRNNKNSGQEEERVMFHIVPHSDDVDKFGEGVYMVTDAEYTCPHCGMRVSRDNIFHDCQGTKFSSSGSRGNQYGEGYEQGQEDARRGFDPNPEGYGGNGQFEKGYEDGYEDW